MPDNYKIISELINKAMFGGNIPYDGQISWPNVFDEMKIHGIASIVKNFINDIPMNHETKIEWQDYLLLQQLYWERIITIQNDLCKIFSEIKYAILKGMSAALLYPDPKVRSMGDIDVLVAENNFEMAIDILKKNGYQLISVEKFKHNTYYKNSIIVEVHNSVPHWITATGNRAIEQRILSGLNNIYYANYDEYNWKMLPTIENGLSLIFHIYHHFFDGIGFRQIIDWMMFVCKSKDIDWEDFNEPVKKDGLYMFECAITKMCCNYFGLPESDNITWMHDVNNQASEDLFDYIAKRGNFGNKLSDYEFGNQLASDNKIKGFFGRLQLGGTLRWKMSQKYKILRPFAWMYQAIRVLSIVIRRKEPIRAIKSDIDESKKIIKLYDELGIRRVHLHNR